MYVQLTMAERLLKSGARVEDAAADWLTFTTFRIGRRVSRQSDRRG